MLLWGSTTSSGVLWEAVVVEPPAGDTGCSWNLIPEHRLWRPVGEVACSVHDVACHENADA